MLPLEGGAMFAKPDAVAAVVAMLGSPDAYFITGTEVRIDVLSRYQLLEQKLWIDVGDDALRADAVAALDLNTARTAALDDHLLHTDAYPDIDAARCTFPRHRLGDRTHAAERVPPLPALAVHYAEHVMEQHVGRSGLIGTREIADDRIEAEGGFERIGFEPPVEQIAGALREQIEQIAPPAQVERAKVPSHFPRVE